MALPLVCEICEHDLTGQRTTLCCECNAEYHQRCWDTVGECKRCAEEKKEVRYAR
jgi:hypothetical protein